MYMKKMASKKYNWGEENPMGVSKRGLLKAFLARQDLCKKLSADEIRLFLLLVVFAEERKSEGKLSWENVKKYLGDDFRKDQLKRAASTLEEMGLARMDYLSREADIVFQLL